MTTIRGGAMPLLLACAAWGAGVSAWAAGESGYQGMAISVAKIERHCFTNLVPVSGVLTPKSELPVRPERDGFVISQVLVEPGDVVGTGQVLARLSPPAGVPGGGAVIKSPASGTAVGVSATIGAFASPSAPDPMFRIAVDGEYELKGEVLGSSLPRLKVDQAVSVDVLGIGSVPGKVVAINASIDPVTQLGGARVSLGNDPRLRTGVFARGAINTGESCGIAIPLSAVLYGSDGAVVQVVRGDRIETRRVEVGLLSNGVAEIRDGLSEADVVVERAGAFLREGDRVRPILADAAKKD